MRGRRVALVDRATPGAGATGRAMGHVMQHDESEPMWQLTRRAQEMWALLACELPSDCEFRTCGALWVAEAEDLSEAEAKMRRFAARDLETHMLTPRQLLECEPHLTGSDAVQIAGALLVPTDSVVLPFGVCRWLVEDAVRRGAVAMFGVDVARVDEGLVSFADGTTIAADEIVVAAGARSADLVPGVPIRRRKGHLVLTEYHPGVCRHECVELGYIRHTRSGLGDSVAFNVQPRDGSRVLIGSCRQYDREGDEVEPAMLQRMLERAYGFMPVLRSLAHAKTWTGFRPSTPDGLPIIGRDARRPWLWLATGHEGYGVTSGIATAELVAELMVGADTTIDATPFAPGRFEASTASTGAAGAA